MAPFQPGDVVVRISGSPELMPLGSVRRVLGVNLDPDCDGDTGVVFKVGEWPWKSRNFRKIDDETTEEFRQQMRSLGKAKERTDA